MAAGDIRRRLTENLDAPSKKFQVRGGGGLKGIEARVVKWARGGLGLNYLGN